ncbi:MAG: response regulator [Planctomycetota bacterium]|jgi:two-component system alkaline phosphatase synthesis response regulator PhoP
MLSIFKSDKKTKQTKILIVDDEPDIVETMQCRLEFCKYKVVTADNGEEGLKKAASEKPDLILLDTNMPVLNGHQMLKRLRNDPALKNIPVIMCTALCESHDIATASAYGITDYVTKPFDYAQLIEKISNALGN